MNPGSTQLLLNIDRLPEDDVMDLEQLTRRLRDELNELDVEKVDLVKTRKISEGTKAGDEVVAWGSLLVTLIGSSGVIPALVNTVRSWLEGHERRRVTLELDGDKLEVTGISSQQQHQLIDAWIRQHSRKMNSDA